MTNKEFHEIIPYFYDKIELKHPKSMKKKDRNIEMMLFIMPTSLLVGVLVGMATDPVMGIFAGFGSALSIAVVGAFGGYSAGSQERYVGFLDRLAHVTRQMWSEIRYRGQIAVVVPEIMTWQPGSTILLNDYPIDWRNGQIVPTDIRAEFVGLTDRNTAVFRFPDRFPERVVEMTPADLKMYDAADARPQADHPKTVHESGLIEEARSSFSTQKLIEFQELMDETEQELERIAHETKQKV